MIDLTFAILGLMASASSISAEEYENALSALCDEYGTDAVGYVMTKCGAVG